MNKIMSSSLLSYQAVSSSTKSSGSFLLFSLIVTILMIVNIYLLIKYFINYKKSIDKTQKVLGDFLVKDYIQGMNFKSSAFFNFIIINLLILSQIFISIFALIRTYKNNDIFYSPVFIASYEMGIIMLAGFIIGYFAVRYVKFNYPQYKNENNDIYNELLSLKELKKEELNVNYSKKIDIDFNKLKTSNVLLPNLFNKWINFYNKMNEYDFNKQYDIFLDQLFKINYFEEINKNIEHTKSLNKDVSEPLNFNKSNLSNLEKEILWMDYADKRVKVLKETNELSKMSREEFNKKYDEYVYSARSIDPLYQPVSRNSWLYYRDGEIEDLFYNTNVLITYLLDDGKTIFEDELPEFLIKYRHLLISKFLLNI